MQNASIELLGELAAWAEDDDEDDDDGRIGRARPTLAQLYADINEWVAEMRKRGAPDIDALSDSIAAFRTALGRARIAYKQWETRARGGRS